MRIIILLSLLLLNSCESNYKILPFTNKLIAKQIGAYTCWAATLESLERFKGGTSTQTEIMAFFKIDVKDKDNTIASMNFDLLFESYSRNGKQIDQISVRDSILNNKIVAFIADNHTSLIVGFDQDNFLVMETKLGQIIKRPSSYFKNGNSLFFEMK
jgi:hypothetical protein